MNYWLLSSAPVAERGSDLATYAVEASAALSRAGHQVTLFAPGEPRGEVAARVVHVPAERAESRAYLGPAASLAFETAAAVLAEIDRAGARPDVIEAQDAGALGYYVMLRKSLGDPRLEGVPLLLHLHEPTMALAEADGAPSFRFPTYWTGRMEAFCVRAADGIVSSCASLAELARPEAGEKTITVVSYPYRAGKTAARREPTSAEALFVGDLSVARGVPILLEAARRLWQEGLSFTLRMIGADRRHHAAGRGMREWIQESGGDGIWRGSLALAAPDEQDLLEATARARVLVHPAQSGGVSYAVISAMAAGVPVLVSSNGGHAELVRGEEDGGLVFDCGREGDLPSALRRMVELPAAELARMGDAAERRAEALFDPAAHVEKKTAVVEQLLAASSARRVFPVPHGTGLPRETAGPAPGEQTGLLSVVVPFFDLGRYVRETADSVLASDHRPLELIVVNDASRDSVSLQVLDDLRASGRSELRVLDLPHNVGPSRARIAGAEAARGEFLAFVDADDLVDREFFTKAIRVLRVHPNLSLVTSWVRWIGEGDGIWPTFSPEFPMLLATNMLTAFVVVRRADFLAHGRSSADTRFGLEDFAAWVSMLAAGCAGASIPEPLVRYRLRSDSLSHRFHRDMVIGLFDQVAREHPEVYRRHGLELYRLLLANGPGYLWTNPTFAHPNVELRDFLAEGYEGMADPGRRLELVRLANTRLGSALIRVLFKLRLDRLFR